MLGAVIGGAACGGSSGSASDAGGGIGRLPSSCGLRTASGWNFGGTGGCTTGVGRVTVGGSPASGIGCSSGVGAGCGRLTGAGGAATGFGVGARGFAACAITGVATAAAGFSTTAAAVFALRSLLGAGRLLRPWWRGPRSFGGVPRTGGGGGGSGGSIRRTCRNCCRGSGGGTSWYAGPSTKANRNSKCTSSVPAMARMRRPRSRGCWRVCW